MRLYPVPFRRLQDYERFQKYQWISVRLTPRTSDPRPESFSPDLDSIELENVVPPSDDWSERCRLVLDKGAVYDDMNDLIQLAKDNQLSLATYKPAEVLDVVVEQAEREWPEDRIKSIELAHRQGDLFADDDQFEQTFKLVFKLPYTFSYRFLDKDGSERKLTILDWETGSLYWNCLKAAGGDEETAIEKVREKYLGHFAGTRDLHLFVGTTKQFHGWASNPFVIIGTFTPPRNRHPQLGLWD